MMLWWSCQTKTTVPSVMQNMQNQIRSANVAARLHMGCFAWSVLRNRSSARLPQAEGARARLERR